MKTNVYVLLMFVLLSTLNSCQNTKKADNDLWGIKQIPDIEKYHLKGNVKDYSSRHYNAHFKDNKVIADTLNNFTEILFDKNGNIVELNDSNKMYNNEHITARCENKKNNKTTLITRNDHTELQVNKTFRNNLLSKIVVTSTDNNLNGRTEVKYNNKLPIEMTEYDANEKISSKKYNCSFDKNNNCIEYTFAMGENLEYCYLHKYQYTEDGEITEHTVYDVNKAENKVFLLHKEVYILDQNGKSQLAETYNYDYNGNIVNKYTLEYNELGDIIKYLTFNDDDTLIRTIRYDLKYDEQNNITERLTYVNDNAISITKNEYTYY